MYLTYKNIALASRFLAKKKNDFDLAIGIGVFGVI